VVSVAMLSAGSDPAGYYLSRQANCPADYYLGAEPAGRWLGFVGFALAFALLGGGLLASTWHLGRPERAWRAFSQWRTSWLSREGVMAVATCVPASLLATGWVFLESTGGLRRFAAAHPNGTSFVDLSSRVCPGGRFDPTTRTSDGVHFTAAAGTDVWPWLTRRLEAVLSAR